MVRRRQDGDAQCANWFPWSIKCSGDGEGERTTWMMVGGRMMVQDAVHAAGGRRDWAWGGVGDSGERTAGTLTRTLFSCLQFHGDLACAEPGAGGEGAHLPDRERAHLDGGAQQPQHPLLCSLARQGRPGRALAATAAAAGSGRGGRRWPGRRRWHRNGVGTMGTGWQRLAELRQDL